MKATASWMFAAPGQNRTNIVKQGRGILRGRRNGYRGQAPYSKGAQKAGNRVVAMLARAAKRFAAFENKLKALRTKCWSARMTAKLYGRKGLVTELLEGAGLKSDKDVKGVMAVGPVPMMDAVSKCTRPF